MVLARRPTVWEEASTRCHARWVYRPGKLIVLVEERFVLCSVFYCGYQIVLTNQLTN